MKSIDNPEMKEVKGIGERLFGLDQLLNNTKKYVQEQADLAQSFLQVRIGNLNDSLLFIYTKC